MSEQSVQPDSGALKPIRYSLRELLADIEANSVGMGGAGGRLLDQHEIDRLFENGSSNDRTTRN